MRWEGTRGERGERERRERMSNLGKREGERKRTGTYSSYILAAV